MGTWVEEGALKGKKGLKRERKQGDKKIEEEGRACILQTQIKCHFFFPPF